MSAETTDRQERTDTRLTDFDGRPADCDCCAALAASDLPCWPCYRDGFEVPNENALDD